MTYRLKSEKDGSLKIIELNGDELHNVIAKTTKDITVSCPMDFAKFPFDRQNCSVEMILDEVLHGNVTIVTGDVMFTSQLVKQKFTPSEFSYDYKVQIFLF